MPSLSLDESRRRADLLSVGSYDVALDLSGDDQTFTSTTTIGFTARGNDDTFLDVKPRQLSAVRLNGTPLDPAALRDGRLPLNGLEGENELVVEAVMGYRHDGEGMHRAVDPADGRPYTYAMSATDAAPTIFACFDQPDLKAPYTFHVRAPHDWMVVGNGHAEQVEPGRWELATTQPLSTYFVTLVAGPYHLFTSEHDGIALGLSCRASLAEHLGKDAEEIFTVTSQCFDEFHRLFGIRYAFGDYHQAFVPEFNMGAMENPGCVTFRDPLVFTSKVTRSERTNRATTIAHEMAHMWFGDLVTMRWWDDVWLSESFAEYMGHRVAMAATEFQDVWIDNAFGRKYWGLTDDQRPSTHPIAAVGVTHSEEAVLNLDGITYAKGAAVVKQLNTSLGEDVFFSGLRRHFTAHEFGNATMQDLLSSWEAAGAADLGEWPANWLHAANVDLISVDRTGLQPRILRTTPPAYPASRRHELSLARHDPVAGWVIEPVTVGGEPTTVTRAAHQPVVLDPEDQTWARTSLDDLTLRTLPDLLPKMTDALMRASVWNAVRDGVRNAGLEPLWALRLVEVALPHETQDIAIGGLTQFALLDVADRLLTDVSDAYARVHSAAWLRASSAAPGSELQLAATRTAIAAAGDPVRLRAWLSGEHLPEGVHVDPDLRWKILVRLATLGAVERPELHDWLSREPTTQAQVDLTRCLSSLPDEEAKAFAWRLFTGEVEASNYELTAAGRGMWQRGQEDVTATYVDRYFADIASTADVRSGYLLGDAAHIFFPRLALRQVTADAAQQLLGDPSLDPGLRRALVDETDELARALRARETFAA